MRVRKSGEVRRREIAEAVLRIIGREGISALTAARIAEEVDLTSGALFRHFESLEGMLDAAVDAGIAAVEATRPDPELPPVDRLRAIAKARVALLTRRRGVAWLLLSDQVYLTVSPRSVARLRRLVRRSRAFLLEAIREGMNDGSLRGDIAAEELLTIFTGTVHAAVGASGVHRGRHPASDPVEALFTLIS